jgi:hypothetical protein
MGSCAKQDVEVIKDQGNYTEVRKSHGIISQR